MNCKLRQFVEETQASGGRKPRPTAECLRDLRNRDLTDTAVIGGETLAEIIHGRVTDQQIPKDVMDAFHLQFPNEPSLTGMIRQHAGDQEEMRGIISGIKGKLFELRYAEWLNDGHLPPGYVARLAKTATQPAWDLEIRDDHGHLVQHLQAKATDALTLIREALSRHPEIDVVTTREAFLHAADPELKAHLIDSDVSNSELTTHVADGVEHFYTPEFHIPVIAFTIVAIQSYIDVHNGKRTATIALTEGGRRAGFSVVSAATCYAAQIITGIAGVGLPVAIGTRMLLSRAEHNRRLAKRLHNMAESRKIRIQKALEA